MRLHISNDALVRMRISEKLERYGWGETKLNRMQVKRTGNSKKIRWTDGNKSDNPHQRGNFLVVGANLVLWSNKTKKLKLLRNNSDAHTTFCTPDGHQPRPVALPRALTQRVFFSWNCYVYPHLYKTPAAAGSCGESRCRSLSRVPPKTGAAVQSVGRTKG